MAQVLKSLKLETQFDQMTDKSSEIYSTGQVLVSDDISFTICRDIPLCTKPNKTGQ